MDRELLQRISEKGRRKVWGVYFLEMRKSMFWRFLMHDFLLAGIKSKKKRT